MQYGIDCVGLDAVRLHNEVFPAISGGEYSYISLTADSPEFRLHILDAVARSPHIKMFSITGSSAMSREEAAAIARISMQIVAFTIDSCVFTDETYGIIAGGIRSSPTLEHLTLSCVATYVARFVDAMRDCATCDSLTLQDMDLSYEKARHIVSCVSRLKLLYITNVRGSYQGIASAAPALKYLRVDYNVFAHADSSRMMTCVKGLVELELLHFDVGEIGTVHLARAISESTTLRALRFGVIYEAAGVAIAEAVEANGRIQRIYVGGGSHLGDRAMYALASAVMKSPYLETLEIYTGDEHDPRAIGLLAAAIATRWRITSVKIGFHPLEIIEKAVERSKANAALLVFCGGLVGPRTAVRDLLRKTGDHAVEHRVLGFLAPTT